MHNKPTYQKIYLLENTQPDGKIQFLWNSKKDDKIIKLKIKGQHNSVFFNADAEYRITVHKKKTVIKDICINNICYKSNDELEFSEQTENCFLLYNIDCSTSACNKKCLSTEAVDPEVFIHNNLERLIVNESLYNECNKTAIIFNIGVFNKLSIKFKITDEPRNKPKPCPPTPPKPNPKPCRSYLIILILLCCIIFTIIDKNIHSLSVCKKLITGISSRLL